MIAAGLGQPSIRRRLLVSIAITAILAAALTVYASRHFLQVEADELLDAQLARAARVFDAALATMSTDQGVVVKLPDFGIEVTAPGAGPGHPYELHVVLQVVDAAGNMILRSSNAPKQAITTAKAGFHDTRTGWRVFVLKSRHREAWLIVGEDDRARRELNVEFSAAALFTTLAGFALLFLVMLVQIERGLKPVRTLARNLAGRKLNNLEPVPTRRLPNEIQPLVVALNQYLERLRKAFRSEQEFAARAAHEMRTPLAALRVHAENALAAGNKKELDESLRSLLRGIERTSRLTNRLLLFTRLDIDQLQQRFNAVDVEELCERLLEGHRAVARNHQIGLDVETRPGLKLRGDPDLLLIALDTLVENAVQNSPGGAVIRIRARCVEGVTRIEVIDQGRGMDPELIARIHAGQFGKTQSGGTGIGLEIASTIAEAHGGKLHIENRGDEPGLVAALCIPRNPTSPPASASSRC